MAQSTKKGKESVSGASDLLGLKLQELFDFESQFAKMAVALAKKINNAELAKKIENYGDRAGEHAELIEGAFKALGVKPPKVKSNVVRGIVADADWMMKGLKGTDAQESACISILRSIAHYKIAGYEVTLEWAKSLHEEKVADLLEGALEEEAENDEVFGDFAESKAGAATGTQGNDDKPSDEDEEDLDDDEDDDDEDEEG